MLADYKNFSLAMITVIICGCAGKVEEPVGQVSGKISLKGTPISEGLVEFSSPALGSGGQAEITKEGTFSFSTPLPAGNYQVSMQGPVATPEQPVVTPTKIPKKYWMAATSGLELIVSPGPNSFEIDLKDGSK